MADLAGYEDLITSGQPEKASGHSFVASADLSGYEDLLTDPMKTEVSNTGLTQEPIPGWQSGFKALTDRLTIGGASIKRGFAGWKLAAGGSLDDAYNEVYTQDVLQAQQDTQDYVNNNYQYMFRLRQLPGWDQQDETGIHLADLPGWVIENTPMLAAGAGTGLIYGALGGAMFGPAGVPIGALVGAGLTTGYFMFGNHVYDAMERGVDKEHAILGGAVSAGVSAVSMGLGLGVTGKLVPSAASAIMSSPTMRQAAAQVARTIAKSAAIDISLFDMQVLVDGMTKMAENQFADPDKQYGMQDLTRDMLLATVQGAAISGVTSTTAIGAGARAKRMHAGIEKQRAIHAEERAAKAEAERMKVEGEQQKRNEETKVKTEQEQVKAKKTLRGYVEVKQTVDINRAKEAVEMAKASLESAPANAKAEATSNLDLAKAELEQARYQAKLTALEDALTDPNLKERTTAHKEEIQRRIETLKDELANADDPVDKAVFRAAINKAKGQLREASRLADIGGETQMRAEVESLKQKTQANLEEIKYKVASANLNKRIATREKKIAALRAEIRTAKKEARDNGEFAPTDKSRDYLERHRQEQEIDKVLAELFAERQVAPQDIEALSALTPTKRLQGMVKLAEKLVERSSKTGASSVKTAKKLLDSVIDISRLSTKDKETLKAKYANVKDLAVALPEIEAKINEIFAKRRMQAAHKDLKAQLEMIKAESGKPSKFPGTEESLMAIREFAEDEHAVDRFMLEIENKDVLEPHEEIKLELSQMFEKPVKEMSVQEIERIIDTIVELRETGKAEAIRRVLEIQARQERKLKTLMERMKPTAVGAKRNKEGVQKSLRKFYDSYVNTEITGWRGIMTIITQLGKADELIDIFDVKSAVSNHHKTRLKWEHRFKEMISEEGISTQEYNKMLVKLHKRGPVLDYVKPTAQDGKIVNEVLPLEHENGKALTLGDMIQVRNWLLDADPKAVSRLSQGNRFSYPKEAPKGFSTLEVIESHLDEALPKWRILADTMREFYKPEEFGQVVNDASKRRFGRELTFNPTYGGALVSDSATGRFREMFRLMTLRPGTLMDRSGGSHPVKIRSALDILKNTIDQYSREVAFAEFEQDAQAIFGRNKEVRKFIARNIGEPVNKTIDRYIEHILVGYQKNYTAFDRVWAYIRESLYSRFLAARPEQFAKQLTGTIHALQFISPAELVEGMTYAMTDAGKKEIAWIQENSGLLQVRKEFRDRDYRPNSHSPIKRINNFLSLSVEVGDHYAIGGTGLPVYFKVLKETGSREKALKAFETAFDTTQSSSNIDELPQLFRGGAIQRLFTLMAQEPTRQVEAINTAWRKYQANPTKATKSHFRRIVGVTYAGAFLYNLMGYMVIYPFMRDDEREQKLIHVLDIAPLGPFSGLPVVGSLLSAFTLMTDKTLMDQDIKVHEPKALGADVALDAYKAYDKLIKLGENGGDAQSTFEFMMAAGNLIGDVTGLPISNILTKEKALERFLGVSE